MFGFSLRTLMLATTSVALLCVVYAAPGVSPVARYVSLVMAFALPAGSVGYDRKGTAEAAARGMLYAGVLGTLLVTFATVIAKLLKFGIL